MDMLNFLQELGKKLTDVLPSDLQLLKNDLEKNFHAVLRTAFAKLDVVTREEFDAQTKVLARSRQKIAALEAQIVALENALHSNANNTPRK